MAMSRLTTTLLDPTGVNSTRIKSDLQRDRSARDSQRQAWQRELERFQQQTWFKPSLASTASAPTGGAITVRSIFPDQLPKASDQSTSAGLADTRSESNVNVETIDGIHSKTKHGDDPAIDPTGGQDTPQTVPNAAASASPDDDGTNHGGGVEHSRLSMAQSPDATGPAAGAHTETAGEPSRAQLAGAPQAALADSPGPAAASRPVTCRLDTSTAASSSSDATAANERVALSDPNRALSILVATFEPSTNVAWSMTLQPSGLGLPLPTPHLERSAGLDQIEGSGPQSEGARGVTTGQAPPMPAHCPVRVHLQCSDASVDVWIGHDHDHGAHVADLLDHVEQWLHSQNLLFGSVVINGQVMKRPATGALTTSTPTRSKDPGAALERYLVKAAADFFRQEGSD
jgi:hypothetical protein